MVQTNHDGNITINELTELINEHLLPKGVLVGSEKKHLITLQLHLE